MVRRTHKQLLAGLLLALLFTAHVGQAAHIFAEELRNFAAFNRDLMPDGDLPGVSERCFVCNYFFSSFLQQQEPAHAFYCEVLAVLLPEATSCKYCEIEHHIPPRAPPMA